jgi:adenylate cyclase
VAALRWAIEAHKPTLGDERKTFLAPFYLALGVLFLWGVGTALLTTLYGLANELFIPIVGFSVGFCGILVATFCYLFTEFALRPVAAQALEAGQAPRRLAPGIMGRTLTVWLLGSGVPVLGIALIAFFALVLGNLTETQLSVAVLIVSSAALFFGFVLMWILSWLTATPVRVVRAALKRVEKGDLRGDLVVFDGTELGELQRGFNSTACVSASGCATYSAATSGAKSPWPPNVTARSWAEKNVMSPSCSSTSSAPRSW